MLSKLGVSLCLGNRSPCLEDRVPMPPMSGPGAMKIGALCLEERVLYTRYYLADRTSAFACEIVSPGLEKQSCMPLPGRDLFIPTPRKVMNRLCAHTLRHPTLARLECDTGSVCIYIDTLYKHTSDILGTDFHRRQGARGHPPRGLGVAPAL